MKVDLNFEQRHQDYALIVIFAALCVYEATVEREVG